MSSQNSAEAKELSLVEKVELRIALAESDLKLSSVLQVYLAPLLLKLASEHVRVRNKVISICQHINTRIKSPAVQLPVTVLLKQCKEQPSPLIAHFDLIYIQQGIGRLPISEREDLLPIVIQGLAANYELSSKNTAILFHLLVKLLHTFTLPTRGSKQDAELRTTLCISDQEGDFLSFWFGKLLLLVPGGPSVTSTTSQTSQPGVSAEEYNFLTLDGKPDAWDTKSGSDLNLTESKVVVLKFLASGAFKDDERFKPGLFASADANTQISELADDILKRSTPYVSLEDAQLIRSLFDLYLGRQSPPVRVALQIRILSYLSKSVSSTAYTSEIVKLVESGVTSDQVSGSVGTSSVSGRQASKLRSAIFYYINFAVRHAAPQDLQVMAPTLIARLRAFIYSQGWPTIKAEYNLTPDDLALRATAYELLGILAKAGPRELICEPGLDLLSWLFKSLSDEGPGGTTVLSIEEALSSVLHVFSSPVNPDVEESLRQLLLHEVQMAPDTETRLILGTESSAPPAKARRSTRRVAVRFANRCLPYADVVARWIDILASSDEGTGGQDVREEGRRGLDPYWYRMMNPSRAPNSANEPPSDRYAFPHFAELVGYVLSWPEIRNERPTGQEGSLQRIQSFRSTDVRVFSTAVDFCQKVLMNEILQGEGAFVDVDIEWERKLEVAVTSNGKSRKAIRDRLKATTQDATSQDATALTRLLVADFECLTSVDGKDLDLYTERFMQLCSLSPDEVVAEVAPRFRALEPVIMSNHQKSRLGAAQAFGVLASHAVCPAPLVEASLKVLMAKAQSWKAAVGADVNRVHGALTSVAYLLSRAAYRGKLETLGDTFKNFIPLIFDILQNSTDSLLEDGSLRAIDQLCIFFVLTPDVVALHAPLDTVIDIIARKADSGKEPAILALGHLAMIFDEGSSGLARIVDKIYKLHEIRQAEAQFAVGEALSCVAAGWQSQALATTLDVDGPYPEGPRRTEQLVLVVDSALESCKSTKPSLKKASAIWIFCLLQFCGHLSGMQQRLGLCQAVFKRCLSDRDELIQDIASRGLGLVYEKASSELKNELVRDVIGSFSTNSTQASHITEDTQLFEPGALSTGDGSVNTYKDVLGLASEVGDPSLVYRFMTLARSESIWTSRAALGRFGMHTIFSDPSVDKYLKQNPRIYAKLYRYRFDPIPKVRDAMNNIWGALVKEPAVIIETYFEFILEDLLADGSILGKEWRVRQASCDAVADLIQTKPLQRWQNYLEEILSKGFKVLDDIKDSVRRSATGLTKAATGIVIRSVENAGSKSVNSADNVLKVVLTFLVSTAGLESSAAEVRAFSLSALLEIVKKSNRTVIQPFIAELVERLLGLLSTMEPEVLNYLYLSAPRHNLKGEQIDDLRMSTVRSSPLMEAIERLIELLDEGSMAELSNRLENAIRAAVGLPSRVGCARVLVSLSTRHVLLFRPYADRFPKLVLKYVLDRNDTVASSYATAVGYVVRVVWDKEILYVIDWCKRTYLTSDEERYRYIASQVTEAMAKHSTDRCSALGQTLVPFVFLAKHDSDPRTKEGFQNAWEELAGGPRAVILYLSEIMALATQNLGSPHWNIKHSAAQAVGTAITSLISVGGEISRATAGMIWPVLDMAIAGKTWDGKEAVLEAIVKFVEKGSSLWKEDAKVAERIVEVSIREARRQNELYRPHALRSIAAIALVRTDVDMSLTVSDLAALIIEELSTRERTATGTAARDKLHDDTMAAAVEALFASINVAFARQTDDFIRRLLTVVDLSIAANTVPSREVSLATCRGSQRLLTRLVDGPNANAAVFPSSDLDRLGNRFQDLLISGTIKAEEAPEALRIEWAEALVALLKLLLSKGAKEPPAVAAVRLRSEMTRVRASEASTAVQEVLDRSKYL